jgi:hypothetical protein
LPLPQTSAQVPQSCGHEAQVSVASHAPLPHATPHAVPHCWHSATQRSSQPDWQQNGSPWHTHASQAQPPQPGVSFVWQPEQTPQSCGQLVQSSPAPQTPFPQGQAPQSCAHVWQVSP